MEFLKDFIWERQGDTIGNFGLDCFYGDEQDGPDAPDGPDKRLETPSGRGTL